MTEQSTQQTTKSTDWQPDNSEYDTIENPTRGCGHLQTGKTYLRADVGSLGVIPSFTVFVDPETKPQDVIGDDGLLDESALKPIPYIENFGMSYQFINGTDLIFSAHNEYNEMPIFSDYDEVRARIRDTMPGVYDRVDDVPPEQAEVVRHLDRLQYDDLDGEHWGQMAYQLESKDLLMRAGASYYNTPKEFIDECLVYGLNKAISSSSKNKPPLINPGRTRMFIMHPSAIDEDTGGIIGYSYLTRAVHTLREDGNVPGYVQDQSNEGRLEIVNAGPEEDSVLDTQDDEEDDAQNKQSLEDWLEDSNDGC